MRVSGTKVHRIFDVATTTASKLITKEGPQTRLAVWVQCDLTTGVPMIVQWGTGGLSTDWGYAIIQPGDSIYFTNPFLEVQGGIPWTGEIFITGSGGITSYRGGEIYIEQK